MSATDLSHLLTAGSGGVELSLGTIAELNSLKLPDAEAVVDGGRRLTWSQLHERTSLVASGLREHIGAQIGDRVAFVGENCLEAFELFHATARAGLMCVPLNERLAPAELTAIVADVRPVALVHTDSARELADRLLESVQARRIRIGGSEPESYDDLLGSSSPAAAVAPQEYSSICFTSGTTGRPKGVLMTQRAQLYFAVRQAAAEPIKPGSRHLFVRPMAVAPGHRMTAWHGIPRGTTIIRPRFNPADFFRSVGEERITNVLLAPTMLRMLLDHGNPDDHDLSSLECIVYGGAPMSPELLKEVLDFFPCSLLQGYGGSEAGQVLYLTGDDHRAGRVDSNGRPVEGVDVEIRKPDGTLVEAGTAGELFARSPMLMGGYWNNPEQSAKVLRDGWYASGDLAEESADGYVRVVGRATDMIISGGFNIMPVEVEDVLATHPDVDEAAVFAVPDPVWGESVCAAIVSAPGSTVDEAELLALCRERLASFKKPKRFVFVDQIPRTAAGKTDKRALVAMTDANPKSSGDAPVS